jgi:HAD superfamily hydrolase (TIGR01509 family)
MKSERAVLWDLDGTLVDSAEYHWIAWRDTMARAGAPISHEQFLASFGLRNDRILGGWMPATTPVETIQRLGEEKEADFRRLALERGLAPLPGAAEWVARLRAAGWRQVIASSAPRLNVEALLTGLSLQHYFDAITSAEDVTRGKPDPQVFLVAASRVNVPPARCIVVEDVPAGVEGARRGGMRSIGVSRTERLDADLFVRTLDEIPEDGFDRLMAGV